MNNQDALEFIRTYFDELFRKRIIAALDQYLDEMYYDDDIGDSSVNHIENSKAFLAEWFKAEPTLGVDVKEAIAQDNVITAFLEWYVIQHNAKRVIQKGVAIFVVKDRKIIKRHTYIYFKE
jgi:hypothetical protein